MGADLMLGTKSHQIIQAFKQNARVAILLAANGEHVE